LRLIFLPEIALRTVSDSDDDDEASREDRLRLCLRLWSFFFFFFDSWDLCLCFLSSELRCFLRFFFEWCDLFLLLRLESEDDDLLLLRDDEESDEETDTWRSCLWPRGERERL